MNEPRMDDWLRERLERYDDWLDQGQVPYTSKVVPVARSLTPLQWIIPTERVLEYLRNARSFCLSDCVCRQHNQRCDNPLEVCFFINDYSDKMVEQGRGRRVSVEKAAERLKLANEHGLVHLTLYNPQQYVYAVCSCCACCCHDLQLLIKHDRKDLVAPSEYIAVTDDEECTGCGQCVERCVFGIRVLEGDRIEYDPNDCYGCGLCVSTCPAEAVRMERKSALGT